ncbi:flagellar brake protein [Pseudomarimonas salicorniae]|uniref:Flagellar brake protein YcgR n=1 Tax=Pseudomarimonas salicorniae TaxID=2933270 RepID=A0ABT0GHY5_9GAMM|nr:flagellar brake protein [Lysobacter sp. CAU 1642]MCK7594043.1 flagellar brake protein [Lysobacter sp. CAU 1642]
MASSDEIRVDGRFGVDDPDAIAVLLRRMIEQRSMLEAPLGEGGAGLLSVLLHFEEKRDQLIFDASPHAHVERRVLEAETLTFATRVDKVNVRFTTGPFEKIQFEGMAAYRAPVPDELKYIQRREYFRLEVPTTHAAYCQVVTPADADNPPRDFRTRIHDISGGGVSLLIPPGSESVLAQGMRFAACKLLLPESPPALVSLRVRRNFRISRRIGPSTTCAGCEYVDLLPNAQTTVQRYLMRLDRERIARVKGE